MNRQQLLAVLSAVGMRPGRSLGQNFLVDANMLEMIVRIAAPAPGELILEVGPGFGVLTGRLLDSGAEVIAVELDHRIAAYLRQRFVSSSFTLIEGDACRVQYAKIIPESRPFRAVANLPYSIGSVFVVRMLELPRMPDGMLFLLQKEMAERMSASPGCRAYGALSVRVQQAYEVAVLRSVPATVFYPQPKVESALVSFKRRPTSSDPGLRRRMAGLVRIAFANRRKQMRRVLGDYYGHQKVSAAFERLHLPPAIRPDRVGVPEFEKLTECIVP